MVDLFSKDMILPSIRDTIAAETEGYSGSDIKSVCKELIMNKIRQKRGNKIQVSKVNVKALLKEISENEIRLILSRVRPSPSCAIKQYVSWTSKFGSI